MKGTQKPTTYVGNLLAVGLSGLNQTPGSPGDAPKFAVQTVLMNSAVYEGMKNLKFGYFRPY